MSEPLILTDPTIERTQELVANLNEIQRRINEADAAAGRPARPRLVAVSKTKPPSDILALYNAGHRCFGENYIQELIEKAALLPKDIQWHFIGSLQSNKIKSLLEHAEVSIVETVDSAKKATALSKTMTTLSSRPPLRIFIQVNTSGEESKSGVDLSDVIVVVQHVFEACPRLVFSGLMTIGAPNRDEDCENPDFSMLEKLREKLVAELGPKFGLKSEDVELSMGMSDDFEQAVFQGSTSVRVGSKIFGSRQYSQ